MTQMQQQIIAFTRDRDWSQFHTPKDLALSLVLEASELLEHFQWKSDAESCEHIKTHKAEVGEELCDSLYCVLLMAHYFDIDLKAAFDKKMAQNEIKYPIAKAKGNHKKYTQHQEESAA